VKDSSRCACRPVRQVLGAMMEQDREALLCSPLGVRYSLAGRNDAKRDDAGRTTDRDAKAARSGR
jgi:hypothetical protein